MTETLRGHLIYEKDGIFYFVDNNQLTVGNWDKRNCGYCKRENRKDGHDACLGELVDVMNACCGHGDVKQAYVQFENGEAFYKERAAKYFEGVKGNDR